MRSRTQSASPRRAAAARLALPAALVLATGALPATPASAGITGVCPDGSIFIVPREELIPCRAAKRIEPDEVPPLRPEYLPRPYTWQVYNESANPNNAYNLVDQARQVRELRDGRLPPVTAPGARSGPGPEAAAGGSGAAPLASHPSTPSTPSTREARTPVTPRDLGLTDGELRDLYFIVELSQQDAPAAFVKESAAGEERMTVSLAYSPAFEARFAEAWDGRGQAMGPVLLFTAVAREAEDFYANFTFSQGPLAYQPKVDDPMQFGVLQGRLGAMDRNTAMLGYVVLPDRIDLAAPLEIYWNDRRAEAVLAP